jgi:hypothetical protein
VRPILEFLNAILQMGLSFGLFGLLLVNGPLDIEGQRGGPWWALPVGAIALLSVAAAWTPTRNFFVLIATNIAMSNLWSFKRLHRFTIPISIVANLAQVVFFSFIVTTILAVAEQSSVHLSAQACVRTSSEAKGEFLQTRELLGLR